MTRSPMSDTLQFIARSGDRRQPFHRVNRKSWAIARFARSVSTGSLTWGFASLHPRLYAFTRSAGFGNGSRNNLFRGSQSVSDMWEFLRLLAKITIH